jgi:hypothetical protein
MTLGFSRKIGAAGLMIAIALSMAASAQAPTMPTIKPPAPLRPEVRPPSSPPTAPRPMVCPAYSGIEDLVARHTEYELRCISSEFGKLDKTNLASLDLGVLFLNAFLVEQNRCTLNGGSSKLVTPVGIATLLPGVRVVLGLDDDTRRKQFAGKLKAAARVLPSRRLDAPVECLSPRPLAPSEVADVTTALALVADMLPDAPTADTQAHWQSFPELGIEAAVEQRLGGKTIDDFGRTLIVKLGDRQTRLRISPHWSPDDLVNIYATPDGDLGFAEGADERLIRLPELTEDAATKASAWRYLGVFGMISSRANAEDAHPVAIPLFAPPDVRGECAPNADDKDAERLQRRKLWKTCRDIIFLRDAQTWEKSR